MFSTINITVNLQDENDVPPVWPSQVYQTSILAGRYDYFDTFNNRNIPPVNVLTVTATDGDASANFRELTYSIASVDNGGTGLFRIATNRVFNNNNNIDTYTGSITGSGTIPQGVYTITVNVTDGVS